MCDLPIMPQIRSCVRLDIPRFHVDFVRELLFTALDCPSLTVTGCRFGQMLPISHALLPNIAVVGFA